MCTFIHYQYDCELNTQPSPPPPPPPSLVTFEFCVFSTSTNKGVQMTVELKVVVGPEGAEEDDQDKVGSQVKEEGGGENHSGPLQGVYQVQY